MPSYIPLLVLLALAVLLLSATIVSVIKYLRKRRRLRRTNYVVRFLNATQRDALRQTSIPHTTVAMIDGGQAVRFEAVHSKRVLKSLNARVVWQFNVAPDVDELILLFSPAPDTDLDQFEITIEGKVRSDKKAVLAIVRDIVMPAVKKDIVVHAASRGLSPIKDHRFHVFLYSSAAGSAHMLQPSKIWHAPVASDCKAFLPSGLGVPFVDEDTHFVVGELIEDCLYLHTDALDDLSDQKRNFFTQFLVDRRWARRQTPTLGLLTRILQHVREELTADQYLAEIIANLKQDGLELDAAAAQRFSVSTEGFKDRRQQVIHALVRDIILPVAGSNVTVTHGRGGTRSPMTDGDLHIFVNSSPSGVAFLDAPERIWGHRLHKKEKVFAPSAMGLPIADDTGFVVCELLHRNLYLHGDFVHFGTPAEAALLARLLVEVRRELKTFETITMTDLQKRVGRHFQLECERQLADGVCKEKPAALSGKLRKVQDNYRDLLNKARLAQNSVFQVEASPLEDIGREFDALFQIPKVTAVSVSAKHIIVSTQILNCRNPKDGVLHKIGAFNIQIPLAPSSPVVWKNTTQRIAGGQSAMHAPHVSNEGIACLGNTKDVFPALIAKGEFAAVVEVAIAFVEAVNVDDQWGKYINRWPVAS